MIKFFFCVSINRKKINHYLKTLESDKKSTISTYLENSAHSPAKDQKSQ